MRILWLYMYNPEYAFDDWLHLKFVEVMKKEGVDVSVYGPNCHIQYPHLTPALFDSRRTIGDLRRELNFDAIVLNTKGRMFTNYITWYHIQNYPVFKDAREQGLQEIQQGQWLPEDLDKIDVPKVMIEEDYHYEKDDKWYHDMGIDLILQRHWSQYLREMRVPMAWLPFSVDTEVFRPDPSVPRMRRACFSGTRRNTCYVARQMACAALEKFDLIDIFPMSEPLPAQTKVGGEYVRCLQSYIAHICCCSTFKITPAKMFEIMSAGSVLLTTASQELQLLFEDDSYLIYKEDGSDVAALVRRLRADEEWRASIVERGLRTIRERHSHKVRIQQLLGILETVKARGVGAL